MTPYGSAVRSLFLSLFLPSSLIFVANLFQSYLRPGCRADRTEEVHLSAPERANFPVERTPKASGRCPGRLYDAEGEREGREK